jgi:trehalose 6-phosphate synthase
MRKLRESVRKQNIFWWVESFLQAAFARNLEDFPPVEEYVPDMSTGGD